MPSLPFAEGHRKFCEFAEDRRVLASETVIAALKLPIASEVTMVGIERQAAH
jgi:hypothetical protein